MAADCPDCRRNALLASQMRGLASAILVPTNSLTGLPPGTTQAFVEGTVTGAVDSAKTSRKRSADSRRDKAAVKRQAMKYKKQNGSWKKDGFKRAVKAAHKELRK